MMTVSYTISISFFFYWDFYFHIPCAHDPCADIIDDILIILSFVDFDQLEVVITYQLEFYLHLHYLINSTPNLWNARYTDTSKPNELPPYAKGCLVISFNF